MSLIRPFYQSHAVPIMPAVDPIPEQTVRAARLVVCANAADAADALHLLDALGIAPAQARTEAAA